MGAFTSCFHVPDVQDNPASTNSISSIFCLCPKCIFQRFKNKHRNIFRLGPVSSPNQQLSSSNSGLVSNNVQVEVEPRQDDVGVHKKSNTQLDVSKEENSEAAAAKDLPISTFPALDDEDLCPTCLEGYNEENPKIITKCCHHYHLSCIYEWMERSENCPMCGKLFVFCDLKLRCVYTC